MEKFVKFTIFHSKEQRDVMFDIIISTLSKEFTILTNHLDGMDKDFILMINDNFIRNKTYRNSKTNEVVTKKFAIDKEDCLEKIHQFMKIQIEIDNFQFDYEIRELYQNVIFEFSIDNFFGELGANFNNFSKLNDMFNFLKFDLNNYENQTLALTDFNNDNIKFKLFSNSEEFYLKSEFDKFISDVENESEDIEFAKKSDIYFNLFKNISNILDLTSIQDLNITLDSEVFEIDNLLYIGFIFEDIYNEMYKKVELKIKGQDNHLNPKSIPFETLEDVTKLIAINSPNYKDVNTNLQASSFLVSLDIPKENYQKSKKMDILKDGQVTKSNITFARNLENIMQNEKLESLEIVENGNSIVINSENIETISKKVESYETQNVDTETNFLGYFIFYASNNKTYKFTAIRLDNENKNYHLSFNQDLEEKVIQDYIKVIKNSNYTAINHFLEKQKEFLEKEQAQTPISIKPFICKIEVVKNQNRYEISHIEKVEK